MRRSAGIVCQQLVIGKKSFLLQEGTFRFLFPYRKSAWNAELMFAGKPTTLADMFCASAREHAFRAALWVDGCAINYKELHDTAMTLAAALTIARGHLRGGQCGLLVDRT